MLYNERDLRGYINDRTRAARALLAEKGSAAWTPAQQSAFDALMDDADQAQVTLQALSQRAASVPMAAAQRAQRGGLDIYLRKHPRDWSAEDAKQVRNAMSTTTGSQGGFAPAPMVTAEYVDTIKGYGWMRQVARQITTATGVDLSFPVSDGGSEFGETMGQNASATDLDPSFQSRAVPVYKVGSKVFGVPIELLQDTQLDLVAFIFARARSRIGRTQNLQFTVGSGTGEPTGLATAAGVGKVGTTGQTTTIVYDDLVDLADSVDEAALGMPDKQGVEPVAEPGWMMSQTMRKVVRKVKDSSGRPIWTPTFDDEPSDVGVSKGRLLGHPVYINNDMPVPAANAKSLAFGNLGSYLVRDALELVIFRMDDSAFSLKGQIGFLGVARAGGNLLDTAAVKLYQHSAT